MFDPRDYPDLVVGFETPDDAAVWRLDETRGLILTTDFFTPIVDDGYDYGQIAAANSLSDVYAMGGTPFLALNVAALPPSLDPVVGQSILRGGAEKAREAGVVIAGGHTVQDDEPKYGLVVAGMVPLDGLFTKSGAKPGDPLYLTKPLGFGTITTALKRQVAKPEDVEAAVTWMKRLNRDACQAARSCGVRGATDITGYSLLGHGLEMANASGVGFHLEFDKIPVLENALVYAREYIFPGGASDNRLHFEQQVTWNRELEDYQKMLLFDPQTSGGLLVSIPAGRVPEWERQIQQLGQPAWKIGTVVNGSGITVS